MGIVGLLVRRALMPPTPTPEQIDYVGQLEEVNTDAVEPTFHVEPIQNVYRADEVTPSLGADAALASAPKRSGSSFGVPAVIEEL